MASVICYTLTMNIQLGKYKHFKGGEYEVLAVATHSETLEDMVVYKALYGEGKVWVRPLAMFLDYVAKPKLNYKGPRFVKVC